MSLNLLSKFGYTPALSNAKRWALLFGVYSSLPLLNAHYAWLALPGLPGGASAALSFAIALLVGFRINQAYDRWWEARKQLGTLVNVSRNLAVKVNGLQQPDKDDRQRVRNLIVAFCFGLKDHLYGEVEIKRLPEIEGLETKPSHLPSYIVKKLFEIFGKWQSEGKLSDGHLWVLDSEARELLVVCGACERIKNTLMSVSWRAFTQQCILAALVLLPWGLVERFGGWTVILTVFISYFIAAGEAIARYVEAPFGSTVDHLNLEEICETIDRSVTDVLLESKNK